MAVVPLILTTLVAGVTAIGDPKKLGSWGSKTLALNVIPLNPAKALADADVLQIILAFWL